MKLIKHVVTAFLLGYPLSLVAQNSLTLAKAKAAKSLGFTVPLRFDVLGDGVELPSQELSYDLSSSRALKLGASTLDSNSFSIAYMSVRQAEPSLAQILSEDELQAKVLTFNWPETLLPSGQLEVIGRSGRVLWKTEILEKGKESWELLVRKWKEQLAGTGMKPDLLEKKKIFSIAWGRLFDNDKKSPFFNLREPLRFCLTRTEDFGYARICSSLYEVRRSKQGLWLAVFPISEAPARVIALNENAPLQNSIAVTIDKPVQFFAETSFGITYEFVSQPRKINFVEMVAPPEGSRKAKFVAWGPKPLQQTRDLNRPEDSYFTELFGWQQTIGDFRNFWELDLDLDDPYLYVPGVGGGMFRQKVIVTKLPREELRPFLDVRTPPGTYVDGAKFFGLKDKQVPISSTQNSVEVEDDQQEFTWYFQTRNRGELNKSYIMIADGNNQFKGYYEAFKGFPREISARLTGWVTFEGKLVFLGELAFQYWFENFLGWNNYYLGRQRWGVNVKYFQSFNKYELKKRNALGSFETIGDIFKITTADVKYRLNPGLWNRDESWGLMLSTQKVDYSEFNPTLFGGGVFWARSMPKVFDDILNIAPFMKYPKWVDAEFVFYAASPDKNIKMNVANFSLNFHGKIMWTKYFFGEAGFGLKSLDFEIKTPQTKFGISNLYGTAGLGLNF